MEHLWVWIAFHIFVFAMLAIDLGIFHREAHEVTMREAAGLEHHLDRAVAVVQLRRLPLHGRRRRGSSSSPAI